MAATIKVWFHSGVKVDGSSSRPPILSEPELAFTTMNIGVGAAVKTVVPDLCHIAVVESSASFRYKVLARDGVGAADANSKPAKAVSGEPVSIGVYPGSYLSIIETVLV